MAKLISSGLEMMCHLWGLFMADPPSGWQNNTDPNNSWRALSHNYFGCHYLNNLRQPTKTMTDVQTQGMQTPARVHNMRNISARARTRHANSRMCAGHMQCFCMCTQPSSICCTTSLAGFHNEKQWPELVDLIMGNIRLTSPEWQSRI